ncbi:hypothetical protein D3C80_808890 [compost metagenome]
MTGEDPRTEEPDRTDRHQTGDKLAPLASSIGQPSDHHHADGAADVRDGRQQADHHRTLGTCAADQLRRPEIQAVGRHLNQEIDQPQSQEARNPQRGEQRTTALVRLMLSDTAGQQSLLRRRQPMGVFDAVLEQGQHQQTEADTRHATEQEQPVPATHLQHTVKVLQHKARERRAHQAGERRRQEQHRGDAPAIVLREPQGQVIQHARSETRLHRADHEAQHVELPFAVDEHHGRRGQAPGHHDPGDPAPGADLVQHHVAGHFENHITDHEQPGTQAVSGIAQAQVGLQLKLGEADVDSVEKGEQVADHDQRHQAPGDFADQGFFFVVANGRARAGLQCIKAHCVSPGGLPVGVRLFLLSG